MSAGHIDRPAAISSLIMRMRAHRETSSRLAGIQLSVSRPSLSR